MTLSTRLSSGPKFIGLFLTALFSAVAFNSTAAEVTAGAVQDWGSGFIASYTITIEDTDTLNGILSNWQIEVQQPESVDIASAWASGYSGGLDTFSSGSTFTISNDNQGFRPDLFAGSQFNINVLGSKPSGLSVEDIGLTVAFTSLDEPPEPVAEVITTAEAISVQDWFNPAFGGGFNVTFECALAATTVTNVDIQLNYLGNGVVQRTSLQGYLGASTQVVSNGNTTVISSSDVPSQTGTVRFQVGVNGAGYSASDFAITCTSGDGIADTEEPEPACEAVVYYQDADGDGYTTAETTEACTQPAGFIAQPSDTLDCDDGNADAFEVLTFFGDLDGDGFTSGSTSSCGLPVGYVEVPSFMEDCNDNSAGINPNAAEVADDGIDQNCDGVDLETPPSGCAIGGAFIETVLPQQECDVLVSFFESTDGANWTDNTGWNTPTDPCGWFGVSCSRTNVTDLNFFLNGLSGSIPTELGNLSNLRTLFLDNNELRSIPSELGNLSSLETLGLGANELSGSIPSELGNLSNLESLFLAANDFSGSIPAELGSLSELTFLDLRFNELSGSIPAELGSLSNLEVLELGGNEISAIPAELGNLRNLRRFAIPNNQLSEISAELTEPGNLSELLFLDLSFNQFSGSIPRGLANLSNLGALDLSFNQFSGSIPAELGNLSNLQSLVIVNTDLSGSIPAELGDLSDLRTLILADSQLSGSIPVELGNLSSLLTLNLSNNELSGSIPAELGNLSSLFSLILSDNELSGSIPAELGNLSRLTSLFLSNNALFGDLSPLGSLNIRDNTRFDIRGNGCFTSADLTTAAFLDNLDPGWQRGCLFLGR